MAIPPLVLKVIADTKAATAGLAQTSTQVKGVQAQTTTAGAAFGKFGTLATAGFAVAGAAALKFLGDSVTAAAEQQRVMAQTEAVIASTGGAAGVTAEQVSDMAAAFQDASTFEDEAVQSAENVLLTFTKIGGDTLPDATQAVLDMSVALGKDLQSSAISVGKALNSPTIGMTALRRVGVSFTDDQVKLITQLDATGRSLDAQRIILAELNKEFGGSAAARLNTYTGQLEQLGNRVDDLQEVVGGALIPELTEGVGLLNDLAGAAVDASDAFQGMLDDLPDEGFLGEFIGNARGQGEGPGVLDAFNPVKVIGNWWEQAQRLTGEGGEEVAATSEQAAAAIVPPWTEAAAEVDERLVDMQESFRDTFLTIDGSVGVFGEQTKAEFARSVDEMADHAVRASRNMAVLSHLPIPEDFMLWLEDQGPGAIDDFVRSNKAAQDRIIADWRRAITEGVMPYDRAADAAAQDRTAHLTVTTNTASLEQLESKLAGLAARYGADFVPPLGGPTTPRPRPGANRPNRDRGSDSVTLVVNGDVNDADRFTEKVSRAVQRIQRERSSV